MKCFLFLFLIFPAFLYAQSSGPITQGAIAATGSTCATQLACVWQNVLPNNAATSTINISGTFSATLLVEESNNGGQTWATAATLSTTGTTTYSVNGFTDIRVRCSAYTSGSANVTISTGLNTGLQGPPGPAGSGGSSSPSSLTTFFNRFMGLSPQDYGASGNVHTFGVCSMTGNVASVSCSNSPFVAGDVGKQFELTCAGGAPNPVQGTITSFTSSSAVGVSTSCTVTQTNVGFAYGTDDTTALGNWITALVAAAVRGVPALARSGYIPQGGYWTTKRLAFIYPGGQDTTTGECAPAPNASGSQLRCSLWLMGAGTDNSYFYIPSNFNWQFPSTSSDNCAMLINHWDFAQISNFAIQSPLSNSGSTFNTTTNTGNVGGLCFIDNTHQAVTNLYVSGFGNTTSTMPGMAIISDFESYYGFIASEVNNVNLWMNPQGVGSSTGVLNAGAFEKLTFDTVFLENDSASQTASGDMQINGNSTLKQFRMRNIHFRSDSGSTVILNVRTSVTIPTGEAFICDECRVTDVQGTGHLGIVVQSAGRYSFPELSYINLNNVSTSANATAFDITNVAANVGMTGGEINCVGCTNAIQFGGTTPVFYAMDTTLTSPATHVNASRGGGANSVNAFWRTATGWDGGGTVQSALHISNQGAVCTTGELALSAGWQSTGSATVTAAQGTGQTCGWTITTGTTTAANPTVTDTLTIPLPSALTKCWMTIEAGGTHTAVAGEGFHQTTLSATAPIFTFNGTPTAGGLTYFVTRTCGP